MASPKITPFTGGLLATNAYLIESPGGNILVDAPDDTAHWLGEIGVKPDHLLLTHFHFDHTLGGAAVLGHAGPGVCKTYAFAGELDPDLTLENAFNGFAGTSFAVDPFAIDTALEGAPTLRVADLEFQLLHVPGHSPDSLCFYLPGENLLFGGDVLMRGGVGRTDFPHGDSALLASGIRDKILPLGNDVTVFPGHGPTTQIGSELETVRMLLGL